MTEPTLRKPLGILAIMAFIALWAVIVVSAWPWIGALPMLAQAIVYLAAGIAWIAPLGPILRWMETGRFGKQEL